MQLRFLQRSDPTITRIMFVSTFSVAYDLIDNEPKPLNKEGSLYLLERSVQPTVKLFLLNRVEREDLTDWISDKTEFADRENYISYMTTNELGLPVRRVIYFALDEEKKKFLELVKFNARSQIREELIRLV